jgi:hypothetical protein
LNPTSNETKTKVTGPEDDPVVESTTSGGGEELVIVIAGGMTSQLTYDGIDVCASRVAWEVSPLPLHTISHIIEHMLEWN